MKLIRIVFGLVTLALATVLAASSYTVLIVTAAKVGGKELKPGKYKVEMQGRRVVFERDHKTIEVPATLETNKLKYQQTSIQSVGSKVIGIELGGTNTRIVIQEE